MAAPTNPTAATLVAEAYAKCGIETATTAQADRATTYFLNEIKNDIWLRAGKSGNTRLKTLQTKAVQIAIAGQSKYAVPSDMEEEITVTILDGSITGTAQDSAAGTLVLASTEGAASASIIGNYVLLTGGTGVGDLRQATTYDTDTVTVTCDTLTSWSDTPDTSTTYLVVNEATDLYEDNTLSAGGLANRSFGTGKPSSFMKVNEGYNEYFYLNCPCDTAYGILTRYYANINTIDTADSDTSTLICKIYQNWRVPLVTGIAWKIAEDEDDDKWKVFKSEYEDAVDNLLAKEYPFGGEFEGFEVG